MSYVDAGYAVALGSLAAYAALLWFRRWRLEQIASAAPLDSTLRSEESNT